MGLQDLTSTADRADGGTIKGNCATNGRIYGCFYGNTNNDLRIYLYCDEECEDTADVEMLVRIRMSHFRWTAGSGAGFDAPEFWCQYQAGRKTDDGKWALNTYPSGVSADTPSSNPFTLERST